MAIIPAPSPAARSVFHQRIRANTEAVRSLAEVTDEMARTIEPRMKKFEQALRRVDGELNGLHGQVGELDYTRARQDAVDSLIAQIDEIQRASASRSDELANRVAALERYQQDGSNSRAVALYATATNTDGTFDARTEFGKLFRDQEVGGDYLTSVAAVAQLPRPDGRAPFVETMMRAYGGLPKPQRDKIGAQTKDDWGRLFDCAPDLADLFAKMKP